MILEMVSEFLLVSLIKKTKYLINKCHERNSYL